MAFEKITESASDYHHLEKMSTHDLLLNINTEDKKIAGIICSAIPQIEILVDLIADKMLAGGRLIYIGAGTSGRLGILDASECVPTFGISRGLVIGVIAGGEQAIMQAVEFAEDDIHQGWKDLLKISVTSLDIVIGLSASGTTPYVIHALKKCGKKNIITGSISCNHGSPLSLIANYPVEVVVGPEFITGSTRMKAGTAQKLVLNMMSTCVMIKLGRIEDNAMVHMQLTNEKLVDRGVKMIMDKLHLTDYGMAKERLLKYGSVKKAMENYLP